MAPLERGGIELIVKNFGGFISSLGKANKAYTGFNKSSTSAANAVTKAGERVAAANKRIETSQRNLHKALLADSSAWHRLELARRKASNLDKLIKDTKEYITHLKTQANADKELAQEEKNLTRLEEQQKDALDRLAIAQHGYTSALESMRNARTRLQAAEEAGVRAKDALNAATSKGINIVALAGTAMKVLGVAVAALGVALGAAAIGWKVFSKAVEVVVGILKKLVGIVASVAREIKDLFTRAFSVALGLGIYDVFRKIGDGVRGLVAEVVPAISFFQKLNIQLEALQARDIAKEMGIPMADAFGMASVKAEELFQWIANLAVKTPFTAQGISETLAMANAMGLNIGMSKQMTKATIDFTAAMGLSEDHMFRIIYNFGQMLAQGKLNGREFRDLANSFVPVWRMLENMAKQAGTTAEELKKLAFEGGVPVEAFFQEFIRMAEEDFAGAAQKMARTLEGVTNNFKDFLQIIIGTSALGPVFGHIAERLSGALDALLKPSVRKEAETIGQIILRSFLRIEEGVNKLMSAISGLARAFGLPIPKAHALANAIAFIGIILRRGIDRITEFVSGLTEGLSTSFQETQSRAATWGYNLVAMFAKGMAAAINLIVMVINTINRILTTWFSPGSPPKIAKDIDKWGAEMIAEWVKGWTNFDISTFSDLADTVESYLRSISRKFSETGLIPAILGARQNIATAINAIRSGMMTAAQAADFVFRKVKKLTGEFKNYIVALFDVEAASKRVAEAEEAVAKAQEKVAEAQIEIERISRSIKVVQDELNAVTEKYENILEDLNRQLEKVTDEYDEQQRLAQINQAIGSGLLTDAEKERLEMEKKALLIKQQIRNTEDERDVAVDAIETRLAMLEREKEAAELRKDAAESEVEAVEALVTAAEKELQIAEDRLELSKAIIDEQIKQNELVQEQIDLLKKLAEAAGGAGGGGPEPMDWEDILGIDSLEASWAIWEDRWDKMNDTDTESIWKNAQTAVDNFLKSLEGTDSVFAPVNTALTNLNTAISTLFNILPKNRSEFDERFAFQKLEATPAENMGKAIKTIADAITQVGASGFLDAIVGVSDALAKVDWVAIGNGISNIITVFGDWVNISAEEGPVKGTMVTVWNIITTYMNALAIYLKDKIMGPVDSFLNFFEQLREKLVGQSIIPEMMTEIYDVITTKLQETADWINTTFITPVTTAFETFKTDIVGKVTTMLSDIFTNIVIQLILTYLYWSGKWGEFLKKIDDIFNLPDGIIAKAKAGLDAVAAFFSPEGGLWTAISGFINGILADLISKLEEAWNWIQKVKNGQAGTTTNPPPNPTGPQTGGIVKRGRAVVAGEMGRELIFPLQNSLVIPNWLTEKILAPAMSGSTVNNTYITNVEVNPTYKNMQSEASVYYDLTAALAAARR